MIGRAFPCFVVRWVGGDVVPLVGVVFVVVEFFGPLLIVDVAVVLIADAMVVAAIGRQGDMRPICSCRIVPNLDESERPVWWEMSASSGRE